MSSQDNTRGLTSRPYWPATPNETPVQEGGEMPVLFLKEQREDFQVLNTVLTYLHHNAANIGVVDGDVEKDLRVSHVFICAFGCEETRG